MLTPIMMSSISSQGCSLYQDFNWIISRSRPLHKHSKFPENNGFLSWCNPSNIHNGLINFDLCKLKRSKSCFSEFPIPSSPLLHSHAQCPNPFVPFRIKCSNSDSRSVDPSPNQLTETELLSNSNEEAASKEKEEPYFRSALEPLEKPQSIPWAEFLLFFAGIILVFRYWQVIAAEVQRCILVAGAAFTTFGASVFLLLWYSLEWLGNILLFYGGKPVAWVAAVTVTATSIVNRYAFYVLDSLPLLETLTSLLSSSAVLCIAEIASVPISRLGQPFLFSSLTGLAMIMFDFSPIYMLLTLAIVTFHLKAFQKESILASITPAMSVIVATTSVAWFRAVVLAVFLLFTLFTFKGEEAGTQGKKVSSDQKNRIQVFQPFTMKALSLILAVVICRRLAYKHLLLWQF